MIENPRASGRQNVRRLVCRRERRRIRALAAAAEPPRRPREGSDGRTRHGTEDRSRGLLSRSVSIRPLLSVLVPRVAEECSRRFTGCDRGRHDDFGFVDCGQTGSLRRWHRAFGLRSPAQSHRRRESERSTSKEKLDELSRIDTSSELRAMTSSSPPRVAISLYSGVTASKTLI